MRTFPRTLRCIAPVIAAALITLPVVVPPAGANALATPGTGTSPAVSAALSPDYSEAAEAGPSTDAPAAPSTPGQLTESPDMEPSPDPVPDLDTHGSENTPDTENTERARDAESALDTQDTDGIAETPALSGAVAASAPSAATKAINATAKTYASKLGKASGSIRCGLKSSGCYQTFAKGSIHWTSATGAHPTYGAIRSRWKAMGWENSKMGYPTAAERTVKGGTAQSFQGGDIHWSSATGAHATVGGIRTAWKKTGSETGVLGFPRSAEKCTLKNKGCYQSFAGGSIHWTSATGAHPTYGDIRSTWSRNGWENGKYGYPTGNAYVTADGRMAQKFQGGTITTGVIRKGLPHGVVPDGGRQLVIAHTASRSATRGDLELWSLRDHGAWKRDHRFTQARFGYSGLATASGKREGDGKTPMGQYRIPFSFGKNSKPSGTTIEYRKVDSNDQWCIRSGSKHYNRWMDAPNANCTAKQAEVLSKYAQYNYAAVVDYNSAQTPNRGSAIFVHSHGSGSTAGCVSVTTAQMQTLTRWLDPKKTPRIVIAPRGELKNM